MDKFSPMKRSDIRLKNARLLVAESGGLAEFAKRVGMSDSQASQIVGKNPTRGIGNTTAPRIEDAFNRNAGWLDQLHEANTEVGPDVLGRVPMISWVQAGAWSEIIDNFLPGEAEEWLPCPVKHSEKTFVLRVRGPSMHNPHGRPSFQDGDLIFVDPDRDAIQGSLVVVRLDDVNEATFKQLVIEGEKKYLRALNPAWPEQIIQINGNATICGVVIFKGEKL